MEASGPAPLHWRSRLSAVRPELCPFQSQMPPRMDIPLPLWALTPVFGHSRGENKTTRRNSDDKSPCGTQSPSSLAAPLLHLTSTAVLHQPKQQFSVFLDSPTALPGQSRGQHCPVPCCEASWWSARRAGAVGGCQVLASSLCPVCLGAQAAGTWCEWARGRGERRGQQEQCWKWKRSDTSSGRNGSGTALNNGEIHSLQTATQSMSETRPQWGDNRTITEKLEFGLLALSWGKSRQNNQRPSTSAESCGTSSCIHWSTRRWARGRGGKEASGRAAHGVHDLVSLISGWSFISNWLQSWGLGHIPSALQLDYEGWPEVTGPHN